PPRPPPLPYAALFRSRLEPAVDLARHLGRLLVAGQLELGGEGSLRPLHQLGEHLPDAVRVVVDRLLAQEDEVRLLALRQLLKHRSEETRLNSSHRTIS